MDKFQVVKHVIEQSGGVAKTAQFVERGLTTYDVKNLFERGYMQRIRHGVYKLAHTKDTPDEKLIQVVLPEAVVCLESALFHYGYSDFTPRKWSIAVPRSMSRKKIDSIGVPFNVFYAPTKYITLGVVQGDFNGTTLPVYDRDKTICDCFKYRTKLDSEIFSKAVNAYVKDERKNLSNLAEYAKSLGVYQKVMNIMEVLLNG